MHITDVTNVANAISRLDMIPTCHLTEDILKGLDENDYIQGKNMHLTRVLSQSLLDNTGLGNSVEECC